MNRSSPILHLKIAIVAVATLAAIGAILYRLGYETTTLGNLEGYRDPIQLSSSREGQALAFIPLRGTQQPSEVADLGLTATQFARALREQHGSDPFEDVTDSKSAANPAYTPVSVHLTSASVKVEEGKWCLARMFTEDQTDRYRAQDHPEIAEQPWVLIVGTVRCRSSHAALLE